MNHYDYLQLALLSVVILAVGISFSRTGRNMKSFFAGGSNVPWWISSLSLFMSFFSAGTFVVWGSIAYTSGLVSVAIQWTMALSGFAIFAFLGRRWKRTRSMTVAEFIRRRFDERTQKFYTWLFVVVAFFTAGAFLYPVAKIVNLASGYPIEPIILLLTFVSHH